MTIVKQAADIQAERVSARPSTTSSNAGAGASRGGDRFHGFQGDLAFPRPGVAHRTVYRVSRGCFHGNLGEPFSLSQPTFTLGSEGRGGPEAASAEAPLTGEATSGGQTFEARMTDPRPFGVLCLLLHNTDTTRSLPDKQHLCDYIGVFLG